MYSLYYSLCLVAAVTCPNGEFTKATNGLWLSEEAPYGTLLGGRPARCSFLTPFLLSFRFKGLC